jgi:hypothetical protein
MEIVYNGKSYNPSGNYHSHGSFAHGKTALKIEKAKTVRR